MKNLLKKSLLTTASILIGITAAHDANAQTAPVTVTTTVQNNLTLNTALNLDFGVIAMVDDAGGNTAQVNIDTAGLATVGPNAGGAVAAIIDDTAAQQAQIEISDGANGATVNVVINNITDPTFGGDTLTLTNFVTSHNGLADAPQAATVPFTFVYDGGFGGGTNTLDIGASLVTAGAAAAALGDGVYPGSFDVVFSY